jgi:hypothetical protein
MRHLKINSSLAGSLALTVMFGAGAAHADATDDALPLANRVRRIPSRREPKSYSCPFTRERSWFDPSRDHQVDAFSGSLGR